MGKGYLVAHQKVSISVGLTGKIHVRLPRLSCSTVLPFADDPADTRNRATLS